MRYFRAGLFLLGTLFAFSVIMAQDTAPTCPTIVQAAVAALDDLCADTERNQACYGNLTLVAVPQAEVTDLQFVHPGDIEDVVRIASLTLSGMDEGVPEWGVALLKLQANLPDLLPGENVTVLLFGDVELQSVPIPPELEVTVSATSAINVRSEPATSGTIISQLLPGADVTVNGRNEIGDWLRVRLPSDGGIGWVAATLVSITAEDKEALAVVTADAPVYRPMQAFYFRSGVGDAQCAEAPESGILIQTPEGVGTVALNVNGVEITLGSTAFLQAQPEDFLYVYLLDGQATVMAFEGEQIIAAGEYVTVPLDGELEAAGPPSQPQEYADEKVTAIPVTMLETLAAPVNASTATAVPTVSAVATIEPVASCQITVSYEINARRGPGTDYPSLQKLQPGLFEGVQQATDVYDYIWYQLEDESWVRQDVVTAEEACSNLPVLAMANFPENHPWYYGIHFCGISLGPVQNEYRPIRIGELLKLSFSVGQGPDTWDEANPAVEGLTPTVTMDGIPQALTSVFYANNDGLSGPSHVITGVWRVTPGTHTLTASWGAYSNTCTFTATGG